MKNCKRGAVLSAIMFGVCALAGCGGEPSDPGSTPQAARKYDVLGLDNIAVGMYVTPDDKHREQKYFDYMTEAGINFVNGFRWYEDTDEEVMQCLNYSQAAGLKFLVNDKTVLDNIEKYFTSKNPVLVDSSMTQIRKYSDHPAYAGQFFIDEPHRDKLEDLAVFTKLYDEYFPGNFWNINMFPTNVQSLGCTYEEFMDAYFDLTNAQCYSYDIYPLLEADNPAEQTEMDGFFYGMDLIRAKTLGKGVPYWSYIQTIGIGEKGVLTRRDPSREDIRWSVFANLAFGSKGIQYFTYFTPGSGSETFTSGMIDLNGEKTAHYEAVKEVNAEFAKYGSILLQCDAEGLMYNKQPSNRRYRLYSEKLPSYGRVESTSGDSFVAGCFRHSTTGKKYLLITAPSPRDAVSATLNISEGEDLTAWIGGERKQVAVHQKKVTLDIAAGDAVFVEL